MSFTKLIATTALIGGLAAPVFAETAAMTTTALTLRTGPSEFNPSLGVLDQGAPVTVEGCLEGLTWCKVMAGTDSGWVSGDYLIVGENTKPVTQLNEDGSKDLQIVVLTADAIPADNMTGAAIGSTLGALTAVAVGGPVGVIIAAGLGGAILGDVAQEITEDQIVFVASNPVDTIYLDGEVVVGATIPVELETFEIPDSTYRYLVINNTPVLVDVETNTIVGIVR